MVLTTSSTCFASYALLINVYLKLYYKFKFKFGVGERILERGRGVGFTTGKILQDALFLSFHCWNYYYLAWTQKLHPSKYYEKSVLLKILGNKNYRTSIQHKISEGSRNHNVVHIVSSACRKSLSLEYSLLNLERIKSSRKFGAKLKTHLIRKLYPRNWA